MCETRLRSPTIEEHSAFCQLLDDTWKINALRILLKNKNCSTLVDILQELSLRNGKCQEFIACIAGYNSDVRVTPCRKVITQFLEHKELWCWDTISQFLLHRWDLLKSALFYLLHSEMRHSWLSKWKIVFNKTDLYQWIAENFVNGTQFYLEILNYWLKLLQIFRKHNLNVNKLQWWAILHRVYTMILHCW